MAVSALSTAPWRRAPLLLRGNPAVLLAVLFAGLVLGAATAVTPLFLSSVGNAALARQAAERCQGEYGLNLATAGTLGAPVTPVEARAAGLRGGLGWPAGPRLLATREAVVRRSGARVPHLGPPLLTIDGPPLQVSGTGPGRTGGGRLVARDGFLDHLRVLGAAPGVAGIWVPNELAAQLGVRPGDRVAVAAQFRTATTRVAGVYRNLNRLPATPYWCPVGDLIYPASFAEDPPPSPLLADRATFAALSRRLQEARVGFSWELPLAAGASLADARAADAGFDAFQRAIAAPGSGMLPLGYGPANGIARNAPGVTSTSSELPFMVQRSRAITGAVQGAVGPVSTAGVAVALLLVAAAGGYWVERRRAEVALLAAKGVGPAALAAKAALEMALPAAAGALLGWLAAAGLVGLLGPGPLRGTVAPVAALGRSGAGLLLGLAVLGLVAGLRARALTERGLGVRAGALSRVPWELALLALAAVAYRRLVSSGPPVATGNQPPRIDLELLAFPLLFLAGAVALAVRLLGAAMPRLRTAGAAWPHALWLAARRLGHGARLALVLCGAAALSIGVLVYAATLTLSVRATLDAKARTFVGSDVSIQLLGRDARVPADLPGTVVWRYDLAQVAGSPVDVLAIDPSTFARGAFWDRSLASAPLPALLRELAPPSAGGTVPVVVVGHALPDRFPLQLFVQQGGTYATLQARVVARVRAFPGMRANPPVVLDRAAVAAIDASPETRLWAHGSAEALAARLEAARVPLGGLAVDARQVLDVTSFLAVSWTFGFLATLGVLTGLITVGGLVLYLETRQRSRRVAYALARRMGLSRAAHLASVLLEVGATLAAGYLVGVALSFVAARLVYLRLDALPSVPPVPLLRAPTAALGGTGAAVLAAAWLGALVAQRAADRTRLSEVLRLAD